MPLYEVSYVCDLSEEEQDKIAAGITQLHAEKFTTPKFLVNVTLQPAKARTYGGGRHLPSNIIVASLRTGAGRTKKEFDEVSKEILQLWEDIVGKEGNRKLDVVWLTGELLSAYERGFLIPSAGQESPWIKENMHEFERLANSGDPVFQDLVTELKTRDSFKSMLQS